MVVLFLSTGRCGTQWLAAGLRALCPSSDVEHEPIGPLYRPRRYFRCYRDPGAILAEPEVASHLKRIARASRPYVETGWPLFAALPLTVEALGERLRIVHLTRHPVPSAISHLAHNSYAGSPRDDAYTRLATLGPTDPRVLHPEYAARWHSLTPYEKCLFWWTEVHEFAIELAQRAPEVPLLRIKSEEVLSGRREPLERLLQFMGLPWDERWLDHAEQLVDRWHHHTDHEVEPLEALGHPSTLQVSSALGYDVGAIDFGALRARYRGTPDPGLDRIGRFA
jgi:hypothetical protein